jgi:hypothetical protein
LNNDRLVGARPRRHGDAYSSERFTANGSELKMRAQWDRHAHTGFNSYDLIGRVQLLSPHLSSS